MKILLSIKPYYADKIFTGEKTVEFRKWNLSGLLVNGHCRCSYPRSGGILPDALEVYSPTKLGKEVNGRYGTDETFITVVLYSSNPIRAIVGEFKVFKINKAAVGHLYKWFGNKGCISEEDFYNYYKNYDEGYHNGYALEIENPILYPKPLPLSHFGIKRPPQSFMYLKR